METVHVYGMRLRGFSPGAQPKDGWIETEEDPLGEYWNVLIYSRQLDRKEQKAFDLDYLGKRERP